MSSFRAIESQDTRYLVATLFSTIFYVNTGLTAPFLKTPPQCPGFDPKNTWSDYFSAKVPGGNPHWVYAGVEFRWAKEVNDPAALPNVDPGFCYFAGFKRGAGTGPDGYVSYRVGVTPPPAVDRCISKKGFPETRLSIKLILRVRYSSTMTGAKYLILRVNASESWSAGLTMNALDIDISDIQYLEQPFWRQA